MEELKSIVTISAALLSGCISLFGLIWWMSATYSEIKSISIALKDLVQTVQGQQKTLSQHEIIHTENRFRIEALEHRIK